MENIDWQFAIGLLAPVAEFGWLQPSNESKVDIFGKYEYIEWRDSQKMPTEQELETAWNAYIEENGTFEEQKVAKQEKKGLAIARLKDKAKTDSGFADLLEIFEIN